jgi:lipopolysaccharide export LptBFGC system permease protein LptF
MNDFWKSALATGGLAVVGAFLLISLSKALLRARIVNDLSKEHKFKLSMTLLLATLLTCLVLIACFMTLRKYSPSTNEAVASTDTSKAGRTTVQDASLTPKQPTESTPGSGLKNQNQNQTNKQAGNNFDVNEQSGKMSFRFKNEGEKDKKTNNNVTIKKHTGTTDVTFDN